VLKVRQTGRVIVR